MQKQTSLLLGAISGGLAVAIGAFGAHALKPLLMETGREATFELAVRYQFYHALALLATGLLTSETSRKALHYSSLCFVLGIILFSGSLYVAVFYRNQDVGCNHAIRRSVFYPWVGPVRYRGIQKIKPLWREAFIF